jgi:hydroxyacylglutathione hydrolase
LLAGIAKHLMSLPANTRVFPGHGPATTIGAEARDNPYLE